MAYNDSTDLHSDVPNYISILVLDIYQKKHYTVGTKLC